MKGTKMNPISWLKNVFNKPAEPPPELTQKKAENQPIENLAEKRLNKLSEEIQQPKLHIENTVSANEQPISGGNRVLYLFSTKLGLKPKDPEVEAKLLKETTKNKIEKVEKNITENVNLNDLNENLKYLDKILNKSSLNAIDVTTLSSIKDKLDDIDVEKLKYNDANPELPTVGNMLMEIENKINEIDNVIDAKKIFDFTLEVGRSDIDSLDLKKMQEIQKEMPRIDRATLPSTIRQEMKEVGSFLENMILLKQDSTSLERMQETELKILIVDDMKNLYDRLTEEKTNVSPAAYKQLESKAASLKELISIRAFFDVAEAAVSKNPLTEEDISVLKQISQRPTQYINNNLISVLHQEQLKDVMDEIMLKLLCQQTHKARHSSEALKGQEIKSTEEYLGSLEGKMLVSNEDKTIQLLKDMQRGAIYYVNSDPSKVVSENGELIESSIIDTKKITESIQDPASTIREKTAGYLDSYYSDYSKVEPDSLSREDFYANNENKQLALQKMLVDHMPQEVLDILGYKRNEDGNSYQEVQDNQEALELAKRFVLVAQQGSLGDATRIFRDFIPKDLNVDNMTHHVYSDRRVGTFEGVILYKDEKGDLIMERRIHHGYQVNDPREGMPSSDKAPFDFVFEAKQVVNISDLNSVPEITIKPVIVT